MVTTQSIYHLENNTLEKLVEFLPNLERRLFADAMNVYIHRGGYQPCVILWQESWSEFPAFYLLFVAV